MRIQDLQHTDDARHRILARLVAALPLLGIGAMHLSGAAPLEPILTGAGIPLPALNAAVAPMFQILAGLLLAIGLFARIGGVLGAAQMLVALYTHAVHDWAEEPPLALPIVVLIASLAVVRKGAGAFSLDHASERGSTTAPAGAGGGPGEAR